jgi:tRNA(Arg) A34 adenosine deaminase TadA
MTVTAAGITSADRSHLERTVALAWEARNRGDHPFGSLLVTADGRVLEARNSVVTDGNPTGHAETNLVRLAGRLDLATRITSTLYTSTEPCAMCAGAIYWSGIGRVVFAGRPGRDGRGGGRRASAASAVSGGLRQRRPRDRGRRSGRPGFRDRGPTGVLDQGSLRVTRLGVMPAELERRRGAADWEASVLRHWRNRPPAGKIATWRTTHKTKHALRGSTGWRRGSTGWSPRSTNYSRAFREATRARARRLGRVRPSAKPNPGRPPQNRQNGIFRPTYRRRRRAPRSK